MNSYQKLKQDTHDAYNALPVVYAFSDTQFAEAMARLGLNPEDTDKICRIGSGGFCRKTDIELIRSVLDARQKAFEDAIAADKDGTGFIKEMFIYELANHEFSVTYDLEDTFGALGITFEDIGKNPALANGLSLALQDYFD